MFPARCIYGHYGSAATLFLLDIDPEIILLKFFVSRALGQLLDTGVESIDTLFDVFYGFGCGLQGKT